MRCAAVVCTYGRESLCELLAMLDRQNLKLPTLIYVDDAPGLRFELLPENVYAVHGGCIPTFGGVRRTAMEYARELFELHREDGVLVLDDDDFYSSGHFFATTAALANAPGGWTGALAMGLTLDGSLPEFVSGTGGVGQHATWAFTLARYDEVGGYPEIRKDEDVSLGHALKWSTCTPHRHVTHVRRQSRHGISGEADFDRLALRRNPHVPVVALARPVWSAECERLEKWCRARAR